MESFVFDELEVGKKVSGVVVSVSDNLVLVDLNQFTEGRVYINEFDKSASSFKGLVKVGDEIEAIVKKVDEEHGLILLSRLPLLAEAAHQAMADLADSSEIITVKVEKNVGRGLVAHHLGNEIFIPAREVDVKKVELDEFVGKEITVKLTGSDEARDQFTATRRELVLAQMKQEKQEAFDNVKVGDVLEGEVVKLMDHVGAFVKLGLVQGLIRYKELSHVRFEKMEDVLNVGDKVTVKVIDIKDGKIDLSRKALIDTPFEAYVKEHKISDVVAGKVVKKTDFGAIVEVAPNLTALLHKNEITWNPNDNKFASLTIGSEVNAAIIAIDGKKEHLSLSLKVLENNPWAKVTGEQGQVVKATIAEIISGKGLKVNALGVDGFIPFKEVSMKDKSSKLEDYYSVGDEVEAIITYINPREWKLELSLRILAEQKEREQFEKFMSQEQEKESDITIGDLFGDVLKK